MNNKSVVLFGLMLVLIVIGGYVVYQQWTGGLGGEKCESGEIGLTKCVGKKEVVYKCMPDPDGCRQRVSDGDPCERNGCVLQQVSNCGITEEENNLLKCVPIAATEGDVPRSTDSIDYQEEEYIRTESTSSMPVIGEEDKIMELEQGELVYLINKDTEEEKILSLKPENIGGDGQNTYILWEERERFRYNKDLSDIEERIKLANFCDEDDNCAVVDFGCPFDCYSFVNKDEEERIKGRVERLDMYGFQCEQKCSPFSGAVKCVDNTCQ